MDPYKVRFILNVFLLRFWLGFSGEVEVPRGMGDGCGQDDELSNDANGSMGQGDTWKPLFTFYICFNDFSMRVWCLCVRFVEYGGFGIIVQVDSGG